jgi:CubicO group peptidase (beta-lactamase class C family)
VVEEKMAAYGVPGVALGVSHSGSRITRGFGITSVENPLPITETTLFQAGSITKTITATVAMRLVEAGGLSLDAPIRQYLPTFAVEDAEASSRATLQTLLTHMGGWEGDFFRDPDDGNDALARIVADMTDLGQVTPFGATWSYNNAGFLVAGRLIEIATGTTYETAVRELLIAPLGLRQTLFEPADAMTHRFAVGHAGPTNRPIVLRPWGLPRAIRPAGGVVSSVDDLLQYAEFQLGDGTTSTGSRLLSLESMGQLHQTQVEKHGTNDEMALGWQVSRIGALREVWHDGAAVGQQALLFLVPSEQLAVVVLTNSVNGERLNRDVRRAVAEHYLGVTLRGPTPITVGVEQLTEFVGRYSRPFMDILVTVEGDRVMLQPVQKQGFPTPTSPVPPPAPPAPYALDAPDRLVGVGPVEGERVEFLRRADGSVGWIRVRGRVAARIDTRGR